MNDSWIRSEHGWIQSPQNQGVYDLSICDLILNWENDGVLTPFIRYFQLKHHNKLLRHLFFVMFNKIG